MRFPLLFGLFAALSFSAPMALAQNQGRIVGVGVGLKSGEDGGLWIESVIPNSPAERAGIKAGDQIVSVNDKAIRDLVLDDVPAAMHGDEGTELRLGVKSGDAPPRRFRCGARRSFCPRCRRMRPNRRQRMSRNNRRPPQNCNHRRRLDRRR